jgi:hypothetical protein
MLFLFGIKRHLLARTPLEGCSCPNCNNQNTLLASKFGGYFHVFFVPFFPTGQSIDLDCYHCGKKFDGKYIPPDIRDAMQRNLPFYTKKRPLWHSLGCLFTLCIIIIIMISGVYALVFGKSKSSGDTPEVARYREQFAYDCRHLVTNPDCVKDTLACGVKTYLDSVNGYPVRQDKMEYFTKRNKDKVLLLLRIDDIQQIETDQRSMIVSFVLDRMLEHGYTKDQLYVGVLERDMMTLVYTREQQELDGISADETPLLAFYK